MSIFFRMRGVERAPASGGEKFLRCGWELRVMVHRGYQPDHVHTVSSSVENCQGSGFRVDGFSPIVKKKTAPFFFNVQMSKNEMPRFFSITFNCPCTGLSAW